MQTDPHGYDTIIATRYDEDPFGLIGDARDRAVGQLRGGLTRDEAQVIVDAGAGTGGLLQTLSALYPEAALHGIDTSAAMLRIAHKKLGFSSYVDTALHVERYLGGRAVDLFAAHFLLAYVEPDALFAVAGRCVRPGGWLSVVTSTFESFARMQRLASAFFDDDTIRDGSHVPRDADDLAALLNAHGFATVKAEEVHRPLTFESFEALYDFGMYSGWLTQYMSRLTVVQQDAARVMPGVFPLTDGFRVAVVLAQKRV